jgi:hypothetical protein
VTLFPVGAPPGQKYEIEFGATGVWTDVTADVEFAYAPPPQIHFGRTSPFAQPGPGSMTFTLRNELGRYTSQRQVLADGVTPHPYWPNVVPRKRVRYSFTIAGTQYDKFIGSVKGWPPAMLSGVRPYVTITATTRDDQLSRVTLKSPILQEMTQDSALVVWPLTDDVGSVSAASQPSAAYPMLKAPTATGVGTFGDVGPGFGDGTGLTVTTGQSLWATLPPASFAGFTLEVYVNVAALPTGTVTLIGSGAFGNNVFLDATGSVNGWSSPLSLNNWHHVALTGTSAGVADLYVDGALVHHYTVGTGPTDVADHVMIGDWGNTALSALNMHIGYAAIYSVTQVSAARIGGHAQAVNGYAGDTTAQRVARYLGFGGVSTGYILDAGQTTVGTYPQAGKSVTQACQDMAVTEGGGAAFWVRPAGAIRFTNRRYRDATTPVLILDALVDLDATVYDPAYDETTLVNSSTANRSAESGTLSTQTVTDPVSVAAFGLTDDGGVTTYTQSDPDALNLAQSHVAGNAQPAFRLDQVAANLHASTTSRYAALAAVEIGSRMRVVNLPPGAAPMSTLDLFVEGWTEYPHPNAYRVVFDTSPVVAEVIRLDDATTGKLGCDGQTLNTALGNSPATVSVVIDTAVGKPTFTTVAGEYPTKIKVGEEVITLAAAPGGATSPQTFTGCLRGQQGTFPAAQAAGSTVTLWPRTGLAL